MMTTIIIVHSNNIIDSNIDDNTKMKEWFQNEKISYKDKYYI